MSKEKDAFTQQLCSMKTTLTNCLATQLADISSCDADEAGKVVDMIKDLAQAEKYCNESAYFEAVVEAMEQNADEMGSERYGYNSRRYSSGRYAPAGRGHVSGYATPMEMMSYTDEYMANPEMFADRMNGRGRYGYSDNMGGNDSRGYHRDEMYDRRYGRAFNEFRDARRHYTDSHSDTDKTRMHEKASEHVDDTISTMREIWKNADVALKKRMKTDLSALMSEMTI